MAIACAAAGFGMPDSAAAESVVRKDNNGRAITFDVVAPNVNVDWYAAVLRAAAHGDEISNVKIRVVPQASVAAHCGAAAVACYRSGYTNLITVGAGETAAVAAALLHEYGHHVDRSSNAAGQIHLDGTAAWWTARGIGALLATGSAALDYSLGWSRSVGEIFAEDYAYIHLGLGYSIPWLSPPDDAIRAAVLAGFDTAIGPMPAMRPTASSPAPSATVATRSGAVAGGARRSLGFQPTGESWHAAVTATLSSGGTLVVTCDRVVVARRRITSRAEQTLEHAGSGPTRCTAAVISTSFRPQTYSLRVRYGATPTA